MSIIKVTKEKKPRPFADVAKFIQGQAAREGFERGTLINAVDLKRAAELAELLPEPELKKELLNLFGVFPKYQVLGMLVDPRGKWSEKHLEVIEQIAAASTEADMAMNPVPGMARPGGV